MLYKNKKQVLFCLILISAVTTVFSGSPPQILSVAASSIPDRLSWVRVDYRIQDPDGDLKRSYIAVTPQVNEVSLTYETRSDGSVTAIFQTCLDTKHAIVVRAIDYENNVTEHEIEYTTSPKFQTDDAYDWVYNHYSREKLLTQRFPDMKVYLDLVIWPTDSKNRNLEEKEIRDAVKLGFYTWASILPDLHVRQIDNREEADIIVAFDWPRNENAGGETQPWDGKTQRKITIAPVKVAFRKLDFVSPKMTFERAKAIYNANSNHWSYYDSNDTIHKPICASYTNAIEHIQNVFNLDPANVCIDWNCINFEEDIPYTDIMGEYRGDGDLAWLIQHEFGHCLGLGHVDLDDITVSNSCNNSFTVKPMQRANDRITINDNVENVWIPRSGFRKNKLSGITANNSPSVMMGNKWGPGIGNQRGVFDLDADALSTYGTGYCDCISIANDFYGYNVSYPTIKKGWLIVLQNKRTKAKWYTNNWHAAHEKMGWVNNDNTKALDTEWFVVDILDEKEVARMVIPIINMLLLD